MCQWGSSQDWLDWLDHSKTFSLSLSSRPEVCLGSLSCYMAQYCLIFRSQTENQIFSCRMFWWTLKQPWSTVFDSWCNIFIVKTFTPDTAEPPSSKRFHFWLHSTSFQRVCVFHSRAFLFFFISSVLISALGISCDFLCIIEGIFVGQPVLGRFTTDMFCITPIPLSVFLFQKSFPYW